MIWTLIVGAIIGAIGGSLSGRGIKQMGCIFNIIAGLAGSYIGQAIFGLGTTFAGMALVSILESAVVVVAVVSFFTGRR